MDSTSKVLHTNPVAGPVVAVRGFGLPPGELALWFGVLVLIAVEVCLITPPVGMNLIVSNSMAPDVPLGRTYVGALPFVVSDILRVAVLVAFPAITLGLVRLLH